MAARSFAYHAHGTADSDKSQGLCAMTKHKSAMDQVFAQARAPMVNHLTNTIVLCSYTPGISIQNNPGCGSLPAC